MTENDGTSVSASLKAIAKILELGAKTGLQVFQSLYGGAPGTLAEIADWASSHTGDGACGCCEIPPPCWMPRRLCEAISYGKAGNTASITFVITNESMTTRAIAILTTTSLAGLTFGSINLTLGPMERGSVEVSYTIPGTLTSGPGTEILLWIGGCRLHFLRWTIKLGPISADTNYEVCVKDGPEYLHHWYDHFYCPRPCLSDREVPGR